MPILNTVDVSEIETPKDANLALDKLEVQTREILFPDSNKGIYKKKVKLNNMYNKISHQANMMLTRKNISDKDKALWTDIVKRCDDDRENAMELKQMKFDGAQIY
tara:strand:+ start:283 stop:597 length:315 start_codon:yes stop_codon:yes gene_type:complete